MQQFFLKATLDNGESGYDHNFHYQLGENIHPSPNRKSKDSCGVGIHLAKTYKAAHRYVPRATEFYLATPIEILGEDEDKVRCGGCNLLRKLDLAEAKDFGKRYEVRWPRKPSLCDDWLEHHCFDINQEDINMLTIEIRQDNKKIATLKADSKRGTVKDLVKLRR